MRLFDKFHYGPLSDPVSAITGGIGMVGNIAGGLMGKSAANKAAQIQQQAAQAASDKLGVAVGQANIGISQATGDAQQQALSKGQNVVDVAGNAAQNVSGAVDQANTLLNPYSQAGQAASGTLATGLAAGGDFNKAPTLADLQIDPGYAFRLQQGELAQQRSAAAHGGAMGGGAAKELANYSQGLASQEYQNAFNRFETSTQNRFGNLMSVSNAGQNAGNTMGQNVIGGAQYGGNITTDAAKTNLGAGEFAANAGMQGAGQIGSNLVGGATTQGNFLTGGANAAASGIIGGANAMMGGLSGAANAGINAGMMNLLKNPATSGPVGGYNLISGGVPGGIPLPGGGR